VWTMYFFFFLVGVLQLPSVISICVNRSSLFNGYDYNVAHCHSKSVHKGYFYVGVARKKEEIVNTSIELFGRIIGAAIVELKFIHQKHDILKADYHLPFGGTYEVSIEVRYEDFNAEKYWTSPAFCLNNEILSNYSFMVPEGHTGDLSSGLSECSYSNFRSHGLLQGFWKSCYPFPLPVRIPFVGNASLRNAQTPGLNFLVKDIEFQPTNCALMHLRNLSFRSERLSSCVAFREICFIGDSQMRHLLGTVDAFLKEDYQMIYRNATETVRKVANNNLLHFVSDPYSRMNFSEVEINWIGNCSSIIINFGQWHVSNRVWGDLGRERYSLSEYKNLVKQSLQMLLENMSLAVRTIWIYYCIIRKLY